MSPMFKSYITYEKVIFKTQNQRTYLSINIHDIANIYTTKYFEYYTVFQLVRHLLVTKNRDHWLKGNIIFIQYRVFLK